MINIIMIQPYLTVPFSFKPSTWNWAVENITAYSKTMYNWGAISNINGESRALWYNGNVYQELKEYFESLGLGHFDLQFFIYKELASESNNYLTKNPYWFSKNDTRGIPHIDTTNEFTGQDTDTMVVNFRFNILLVGDEDLEMVWWNNHGRNSQVVSSEPIGVKLPTGGQVKRVQVIGQDKNEQYSAIGNPTHRASNLYKLNQTASFVKTDILHTLHWNGNKPRYVLSARFCKHPWDLIEKHR